MPMLWRLSPDTLPQRDCPACQASWLNGTIWVTAPSRPITRWAETREAGWLNHEIVPAALLPAV
jgi:hypothetical protein